MKWQALLSLIIPMSVVVTQTAEFIFEARTAFGFCCLLLVLGSVVQLWWTLRCLDHQRLLNAINQYAILHSHRITGAMFSPVEVHAQGTAVNGPTEMKSKDL